MRATRSGSIARLFGTSVDLVALYFRKAIGKAMANTDQGWTWKLLRFGVFASVALAFGYGLSHSTVVTNSIETRPEKTVLAQRVDTAREVRQALAKPLPAVEPLPPVTAKLANQPPQKSTSVAVRDQRKYSKYAWYTDSPGSALSYVTLSR